MDKHNTSPDSDITIRPWAEIAMPDLPDSRKGLERLRPLFHDLLVRNQRFIGALEDYDVPDESLIEDFLSYDTVLLFNYSLLLDGEMDPIEVGAVIESLREQAESLTDLRHRILTTLDGETAARVMDSEPDQTVRELGLSYRLVQVSRVLDSELTEIRDLAEMEADTEQGIPGISPESSEQEGNAGA